MNIETQIKLDAFRPREYQLPVCDALENKNYKKLYIIWPRRCLAGNTHILMADGSFKFLKDIRVGDKILSWNGNSIEEDTVKNVWSTGVKQTKTVRSSSYLPLVSSADHQFAHVGSGKAKKVSWTPLKDISKNRLSA